MTIKIGDTYANKKSGKEFKVTGLDNGKVQLSSVTSS